jgi:hypothetical protein
MTILLGENKYWRKVKFMIDGLEISTKIKNIFIYDSTENELP